MIIEKEQHAAILINTNTECMLRLYSTLKNSKHYKIKQKQWTLNAWEYKILMRTSLMTPHKVQLNFFEHHVA